ncbi:hypothetical protein [Streptomyces palmae]|uniref:Uncharacterized protein n=1 Tax=Streptomyces palmae TaxID=1701085 RepID=A0A4Z0HI77_9ACTN|nr:hypothetical protein [Streptomyces palmae]TGB16981.1 hypothetical protein E4099_04205 [Streptomyces palmae]
MGVRAVGPRREQKGTPMYEMRKGPATTGTSGFVWHVITKEDGCSTLCGRRVASADLAQADPSGTAAEGHCVPCMDAFSQVLGGTDL